jgi:hypothetical protein
VQSGGQTFGLLLVLLENDLTDIRYGVKTFLGRLTTITGTGKSPLNLKVLQTINVNGAIATRKKQKT